jgi:hypothetical protein
MPINFGNQPTPKRQRVLTFVSPNVGDILFYETVDAQRVKENIPSYGTAHPDTANWPNHELVYVQQDSPEGQLYRYYYAANRASQDDYNYELRDGSELTRTYIIKRSDYPSDLAPPDGGTLDSVFTDYGFVGDTIKSVGDPLAGIYIAVQRRFVVPQTVDYVYDANLEGNIKVTKTIVPSGYDLVSEGITNSPGDTNEVRHGNNFHDVLINQTIKDSGGDIDDRDLETVYGSQKYDGIPQRLDSVVFDYVSAFVESQDSEGNRTGTYAEDNTAEFGITAPSSGPFKTKIQRTLTANPQTKVDSILSSATQLPRPKREDISIKFVAHSTNPPVAKASARQYTVPTTIHGVITPIADGTVTGSLSATRVIKPTSLSATPGFNGSDLSGDYLINVTVRQTSLDLFIVESTELQLNGVYS